MLIEVTPEEVIAILEYHAGEARFAGGDLTPAGKAHWARHDELWAMRKEKRRKDMEGAVHNASQGDDSRT